MTDSNRSENLTGSEIAIIGMSCRFPGARNIDEFWKNLRDGVESITFFTDEQLKASGVSPEAMVNKNYVKARPIIEDIELFDAAFFGFNPREAAAMDPQHRLFLECVWDAIESAGYDVERYGGAISVYAGSSMSSYLLNNLHTNPKAMELAGEYQTFLSNIPDSLTTRIAYKLNLKGPCSTVQTFCSTSLVAAQMACQSLLNFECDMAVAGGVSIFVPQHTGYWYQEGLIVSPDGHCRAFDAEAKGTIFGNGLGAVVMKRFEDALEDGDSIDAVIKGSAKNNDGSLKVSYTAPSVTGQAEVIVEAMANAGVEPETITYVETHGTGTALGDPTEVTALTQAFRSGTQKKGFCAIGSVKTNIGHLDASAGVASLIKTVLALKHKQIPPSLHFKKPNPNIDFENSPFYVNSKLSEWKTDGAPRRAGVSSFGIGGTNAHVILEEGPQMKTSGPTRPYQLIILSAKTGSALEMTTQNLFKYLENNTEVELSDCAYTLQEGRKTFNHRRMLVCQNIDDAVLALKPADPKRAVTVYQEQMEPPVAFMFSGQGAQYVNMGLELYRTESIFQKQIDHCSEILKPYLSLDLKDILYPDEKNIEVASQKLNQTFITQPALFAIEYALAKLWSAWGINPEVLVGHSIGEYVAACLAGVFSLEDALSLVAIRGRLMQELPEGSMLAVHLSEQEIQPFLNNDISLAAVNAPSLCVVSGEKEIIENLEKQLSEKNVFCRYLITSHAFHSRMMEPIIDTFNKEVKKVRIHPPQIPFISNVTGTWITVDEATDSMYWAMHLRQTVRFFDCVNELYNKANRVLLEVGPGHTLSLLARKSTSKAKEHFILSSIRHPHEELSDISFILETLGMLWLAGIQVDWSGFYKNEKRHRLPLPTYPFERQRFWIKPVEKAKGFPAIQAGLTELPDDSQYEAKSEIQNDFIVSRDQEKKIDTSAPRNKLEKTIVEIWERLLGINKIGIRDNYFDLGGDSVLAVRLFAQIEKIFGKKLPLAVLYKAPTVEQLADILSKEDWTAPWSSLVAIKSEGSKPPFFCMHGAGGNVLIYRDLAHRLSPDQPFYGLQAKGLDGKQPFNTRIEDMAAQYINEMQTVQPEGPYYLGGYCMGGTLALEMAQQLHSQNQEVALLALMETYNWANLSDQSLLDDIYFYIQKIGFHFRNFLLLEFKGKLRFIREKAKVAKDRTGVWYGMILSRLGANFSKNNEQYLHLAQLWKTNDLITAKYVPKSYSGPMTLFKPAKQYARYDKPELSWHGLANGGLDIQELPVYPAGMVVEPFVQILAEKLQFCIDRTLEAKPNIKM